MCGQGSVEGRRWLVSLLSEAVRRLLVSFSGLSKLLGSSQRRVIVCGHSLAASVGGGIPFGESRADSCRRWLSLLSEAVR